MAMQLQEKMQKIKPLCPVFGECGGCSYQDMPYSLELRLKEHKLRETIKTQIDVDDDRFNPIVASPHHYRYRHRIDLKLKRTRNGILIGFTPKHGKGILPIESCPIAMETISQEIPRIKKEAVEKLPNKYRQANLTIRSCDDGRVYWGGIGKGSLRMDEENYLWSAINGQHIYFTLETFFQANLSILPKLIDTIHSLSIWNKGTTVYDLYGGVGLFSITLADIVRNVILIEEVSASVKMAKYNALKNCCNNIEVIEGRVEDHLGYLREESIVIIDPPRAGLSDTARELLSKAVKLNCIIYLSCNPEALTRDLKTFIQRKWHVERIVPFDFFPRTKHIETLSVIKNGAYS